MAYLLRHGDVWVTFFDSLFFPLSESRRNDLLLRVFRLVGLKIVAVHNGLDVVYEDGRTSRFDWLARLRAALAKLDNE